MSEFNKGDLVVKKGTTEPVMEIMGNAEKTGVPYESVYDRYVCIWVDIIGENVHGEFDGDQLQLISKAE